MSPDNRQMQARFSTGREELIRALDDLAGLVPAAQCQQRFGHVIGQDRAIGPGERVFTGGCQPLAGHLGGQVMQACSLPACPTR